MISHLPTRSLRDLEGSATARQCKVVRACSRGSHPSIALQSQPRGMQPMETGRGLHTSIFYNQGMLGPVCWSDGWPQVELLGAPGVEPQRDTKCGSSQLCSKQRVIVSRRRNSSVKIKSTITYSHQWKFFFGNTCNSWKQRQRKRRRVI